VPDWIEPRLFPSRGHVTVEHRALLNNESTSLLSTKRRTSPPRIGGKRGQKEYLSNLFKINKALVEADGDCILEYTDFGVGIGEVLASVQIAMITGLPYTALRDAMLTHPTLVEALIPLFSSVPSKRQPDDSNEGLCEGRQSGHPVPAAASSSN